MKKALVILLALTMVVSMFAVAPMSVAAEEELTYGEVAADYKPEGEAIKTAEEFLNMKADGKYYLANDITVGETYYDTFTGTLDGNGKTITVIEPIFENLDGTVKNLTIAGSITIEAYMLGLIGDNNTGALAHYAACNADTTIDNVCNKAVITSYACGMGGLVGRGAKDSAYVLTITNSANYGNITTNCATTSNYDCGGLVAFFAGLKTSTEPQLIIDNCANYGTINADGRPGGIVGNVDCSAKITNCVNYGDVQAIYNYCGGIAARFGRSDYTSSVFYVENCVNYGNLYQSCSKLNPDGTNPYKNAQVGGIVGYQGNVKGITYKNCTNNGNIHAESKMSHAFFGGISGGCEKDDNNKMEYVIYENCVNNGNISADGLMNNKNAQVGGMGAYLAAKEVKFINCINNGNLSASVVAGTGYAKAGGLSANIQNQGSGNFVVANGCINTGDVTVDCTGDKHNSADNQAAGIFGYVLADANKGVDIQYCITTGVITGNKMVSGLVGYINAGKSTVRYNIIAGKIVSTDEAIVLQQGKNDASGMTYQDYFTFNYNGVDYYFLLPYNADYITITGTDVVPHYTIYNGTSGQVEVADGGTYDVISGKWCYWFDGAKSYCFKATQNGTVTIDGAKAFVDDVEQTVTDTSVDVFTETVATRALVWSNKMCFEIKDGDNFIQVGAAGVDYAMGDQNTFGPVAVSNASTKYTKDQFASGEVAIALNEKIGEVKFYQNLLPTIFVVDEYPTPDATHAKVVFQGGVYTNQLFDMNPDVTPPTGDATVYVVIALAVATVSLAALAVVKKNKEN